MLDLFCGRGGWTNAFLARGWECVGIDLNPQPEYRGEFIQADILETDVNAFGIFWYGNFSQIGPFDFICASSPCEEFSVHGLRCFHPNPKYPDLGIKLFNHTRAICEESGVPYVMENVRPAENFVGKAVARCGPFALWGNGVPPILPQGIRKGVSIGSGAAVKGMSPQERTEYRKQFAALQMGSKSEERKRETAAWATIPPELANCVADYAERIICVKAGE